MAHLNRAMVTSRRKGGHTHTDSHASTHDWNELQQQKEQRQVEALANVAEASTEVVGVVSTSYKHTGMSVKKMLELKGKHDRQIDHLLRVEGEIRSKARCVPPRIQPVRMHL